jgi:hypothetical protein
MLFPDLGSPLVDLRFPHDSSASCTLWIRSCPASFPTPPSKTHNLQHPFSKQVVPYWTRGGTCCPRVSTPKTRSLADSSMTIHITWRNPTVSTIPTHAQTTASILTKIISHHDGWKTKTLNNNTSQTQHHKDGNTCMTLMTAWLSITNQVWTHISKIRGLGNSIKACRSAYILERER